MTPTEQILFATAGMDVEFAPGWDDPAIRGTGLFDPRFVMLHHTGGTDSWHLLVYGNAYAPVRGANVLIDRDGKVHVLSVFVTYHAGKGGPKWGIAAGMANPVMWGIEIEDLGVGQTMTEAQIESAARLSYRLLLAMGEDDTHLVEHEEWSTTGKVDTQYSMEFWRARVQMVAEEEQAMAIELGTVVRVERVVSESAGYGPEVTVEEAYGAAVRCVVLIRQAMTAIGTLASDVKALSAAVAGLRGLVEAQVDPDAIEAGAARGAASALSTMTLRADVPSSGPAS